MSRIDRTFNPIKQALSDRRPVSGGECPWRTRICWNCMQDKPTKGGTFPNGNQKGRNARFRCADCTKLKETK